MNDRHNIKENRYLGNTLVKRDGIKLDFTEDEVKEYIRCSADPIYFCKKYIKVVHLDHGLVNFNLYPYQKDMIQHFNNNRFSIVLACRQSGKSITTIGYILWYICFHSDKTVFLLANKGATAREMLSRLTLMLENLPFFLQPGCKELNKGSISFSNNSKVKAAATSSNSIRGNSANLIVLDEFAFVNRAGEFFTSTFPVISSGNDSKVIITSTPNGIGNMFHQIWTAAVQGVSDFKPFTVNWWDVPGRDEEWKKKTIANTSEAQFRQEFCLGGGENVTIRNITSGKIEKISLENLYQILNSNKNTEYEILTPTGFKHFDGISKTYREDVFEIFLNSGQRIIATSNHKFATGVGTWVETENIIPQTTTLIGGEVVERVVKTDPQYTYDAVNVEDVNCFLIDNNIISHNSIQFVGSGNTLIDANTLLALRHEKPISVMQNGLLKIYEEPIKYDKESENSKDHFYIMTVDVSQGRGQDCSAFSIFDITSKPFKQVCTFSDNKISPLIFPSIIVKLAEYYNKALVLIENNGPGQIVCNSVWYDYEYENLFVESSLKAGGLGVTQTKKTKRIGTSNLKDFLEARKLKIVDDETIKQLCYFEEKGNSYQASNDQFDDLVMTLVLFSWFLSSQAFGNFDVLDLKKMIFESELKKIEDEMVDFGLLLDNTSNDALPDDYIQMKKDLMDWKL